MFSFKFDRVTLEMVAHVLNALLPNASEAFEIDDWRWCVVCPGGRQLLPLEGRMAEGSVVADVEEWQKRLETYCVRQGFAEAVIRAAMATYGVGALYGENSIAARYPQQVDQKRLLSVLATVFTGVHLGRCNGIELSIDDEGRLVGKYETSSWVFIDLGSETTPNRQLSRLLSILDRTYFETALEFDGNRLQQPPFAREAGEVYDAVGAIRQAAPYLALAISLLP